MEFKKGSLEQQVAEWCVNYVRELIKDDAEEVVVGLIMDDTGASEWEIMSVLETLSPEGDE